MGNKRNLRTTFTEEMLSVREKISACILKSGALKYSQNHGTYSPLKLVLEKAEEPEIKLPTSAGSWKKQESSIKTSISALLTMPKPLTVWITINCGTFFKKWEHQTTLPAS